jgi:hypothetical protein
MLRDRMPKEKSPPLPPGAAQPQRRPGRSGEGMRSLVAQMNQEARVDELLHRGRQLDGEDRRPQKKGTHGR